MSRLFIRQSRISMKLLLAVLLPWAFPVPASAGLIDVNVMVQGFPGTSKIGTIDAQSGPATDTDYLAARFAFADGFKGSILDGLYDFQWINVVTSKIGDDSPLFDKYPNIDPQAPPKNANEDNEPYYYHQANEWDPGMFGTEDIRGEGLFSLFSDSPQRALGNGFNFNAFLVAQDLTAGDFIGKKSSVLAGFSWTYMGGMEGNPGEDVSTFGAAIAINQGVIDGVNTAIGNEANNSFAGWTALGPQTLMPSPVVPEPASLTLLSIGVAGLLIYGRRRQRGRVAGRNEKT